MSDDFNYDEVAVDGLEEAETKEVADDGKAIIPMPNPKIEESPVLPLGFTGGKLVFLMPEGEIRTELASKIGTMLRTDIFACAAGQSFLAYWRDREDKFLRDLATVWFVRKCREAGLWDTNRPMRSLGVWPGDDGAVVLHLGDEVWRLVEKAPKGGERISKLTILEAMRVKRGALYRLRPPAPRPDKSATTADGVWVRETLDLWRFEAIGHDGLTGADVVLGWAMAGLLGAVAPFRGHLMVNAMAGSGKSTLAEFIHALQSALAGDVVDSFSDAGLRNDLAGMARPTILDEAEGSQGAHGPGAVEKALEMLRRMSTGSGATRKQGDIGGGVVTQTAVGAVALFAINPPKLGPADATRIVEVRLFPLAGDPKRKVASRAEIRAAIDKAKALGPHLLGRALRGAWRYRDDVDALSAAFTRAGESPRTGDLIAMLAAGRRLLLSDKPLTAEEADAEVVFWRPLLDQRAAAEGVTNPGSDCLAHLMAAETGQHLRDRRTTVGDLVNRWMKGEKEYDDVLKSMGLRIFAEPGPDGRQGPWLLVANHHPTLERIFRGTVWGDWRRALAYTDELGEEFATWPTKPQNFGVGVKQRALAIPLAPWFGKAGRVAAPGYAASRSTTVPDSVPGEDLDTSDYFG